MRWLVDYTQAGGSRAVTPELVKFLDRVMLLGAQQTWQRRFASGEIPPDQRERARVRWEAIGERLRIAINEESAT